MSRERTWYFCTHQIDPLHKVGLLLVGLWAGSLCDERGERGAVHKVLYTKCIVIFYLQNLLLEISTLIHNGNIIIINV